MTGASFRAVPLLMIALAMAIAVSPAATAAAGDLVYVQDWESGAAGWTALPGYTLQIVADGDAARGQVQFIDEVGLGGNFFGPFFAVQPSTTYCAATWIKWDGGGWPFLGIDWNAAGHVENWLIGHLGNTDGFGGQVTPVPDTAVGWHWYSKEFVSPAGVDTARFGDEAASSASKAGETSVFFDDILLLEGPCPESAPFPVPELATNVLMLVGVGLLGATALAVRARR